MKGHLRNIAGLPDEGPASKVQEWLEKGPNAALTFTELHLDWSVKTFAELGVAYGNVWMVQECPSCMPRNLGGSFKLWRWIQKKTDFPAMSATGFASFYSV